MLKIKKIYRTQDQVLSQTQLGTLIVCWVFALIIGYVLNSFIPIATALATEAVFIAYMFYAEFRYTSVRSQR